MSLFGRNREVEVVAPETPAMPNFGTGPMMLLRSFGLDPEELWKTFQGMEQVLRATVAEAHERIRVISIHAEATAQAQSYTALQVDRIHARLDQLEAAQTAQAADLKIIVESLAELHRRQLASFPEPVVKSPRGGKR